MPTDASSLREGGGRASAGRSKIARASASSSSSSSRVRRGAAASSGAPSPCRRPGSRSRRRRADRGARGPTRRGGAASGTLARRSEGPKLHPRERERGRRAGPPPYLGVQVLLELERPQRVLGHLARARGREREGERARGARSREGERGSLPTELAGCVPSIQKYLLWLTHHIKTLESAHASSD